MKKGTFKGAAIFSVSALALAVSSAANAYTFNVNDTEVTIGGYAKLDMIYDVDGDLDNSVAHGNIALDGADSSDGHTTMHAFQSRFGFQTATPLNGSVLKTNIEGDFYGDGGGSFRLRHAYGSWNGILAGQTWTNFSGGLAATPTIDFTGVGGIANTARQSQLRYTTGNFSVALEDPNALGKHEDADYEFDEVDYSAAKSQLPDLTARYTNTAGPIKYSAAALLRQLEYDVDQLSGDARDAALAEGYGDDKATGWGIALEASVDVSSIVTLRGGLAHGKGIGGYINVSPNAPAYVDTDGDLNAIESTGGTLGASIKTGPGAINVAYSVATADLDTDDGVGITDSTNETFESAYLNYIWSPADRISYGVEAGWHSRETVGGDDGDAVRLQGMVMYSF